VFVAVASQLDLALVIFDGFQRARSRAGGYPMQLTLSVSDAP